MSRKKTLSATAALASCLEFAARVLSSTASVQHVCTKPVLAPMVVEAHRFGQQVMKHVDPGAPADVRTLLRILQDDESTKLQHESPLAGLAMADLTWDFEGTVAHTLEMELEELQSRAVTASGETCVVLSAFSSLSASRHTVVWFPNDNNQRSRNEDDAKRKAHILLFVCPGRVKVVKNVSELLKKMFDELPSLRESGATYKVWAVTMANARGKQYALSVRTSQSKSNQDDDERLPSSLVVRVSAPADNQAPIGSIGHDSNQEAADISPADSASEIPDGSQDQDNLPIGSPRFTAYSSACDAIHCPSNSMFSFGLLSATTPTRASDSEKQTQIEEASGGSMPSEACDMDEECSSELEAECPVGNQCVDLRSRRAIVSASLAGFANELPWKANATGLELGAPHESFAWQSCDGKVLRKVGLPQRATFAVEERTANILANDAAGGAQARNAELHNEDDTVALSEIHYGALDGIELEGHGVAGADGCAEHCSGVPGSEASHFFEEPSSIIFTFRRAPTSPLGDDSTGGTVAASTEMLPNIDTCRDSGLAHACGEVGSDIDSLRASEHESKQGPGVGTEAISELLDLPAGNDTGAVKPKPVNYKDKLGARVWFELECTARRLENEEILERRKQIRRPGGRLAATGYCEGPRRMKPSRWSKPNRPIKPRELLSDDVGSIRQLSTAVEVAPVPDATQREDDAFESSLLESEAMPLEAIARQTFSRELSDDREELAIPCTEASTKICADDRNKPEVCENLTTTSLHDLQNDKRIVAELSHESVEPISLRESLLKSRECLPPGSDETRQRQGASISDSVVGSESSTPRRSELSSQWKSNHLDEEDRASAQTMWGSTHRYELNDTTRASVVSKEHELHTTAIASAVPFTARGRVPMRSRSSSSKVVTPASDNASSSSGTAQPNHDTAAAPSNFRQSSPVKISRLPAPKSLQAISAAAPVATFIALSDDRISSSDNAASTRRERLDDLRQKKLHKLQQTRDLSLRQQKEKKQQRQVHRPLSFANSVYSKKASNRQLIQNALEFTLLAGGSMEKERTRALQALAESTCDNFIVLLKSPKELKFRALYENHVDRGCAIRIFSVLSSNSSRAPAKIGSSEMLSQFFKYSSAKKQFLPVPTRSFTVKTDACALVDQLVFKGKSNSGAGALARLLY